LGKRREPYGTPHAGVKKTHVYQGLRARAAVRGVCARAVAARHAVSASLRRLGRVPGCAGVPAERRRDGGPAAIARGPPRPGVWR